MTFDVLNGEGLRAAVGALWNKIKGLVPTKVSQLENDERFISNVSADFLTSDGFGKLRYLNGVFQYWNDELGLWIDATVTPESIYVTGIIPQPMKFIAASYNKQIQKVQLRWQEPNDTILENQLVCIVEKVIIRRKLGSAPENREDGELVIEVPRRDFGKHTHSWFIDYSLEPQIGNTYYYKAFPVSTSDVVNSMEQNAYSVEIKGNYILYGFTLNQNESNPASMITYIEDNAYFSPAHMDYATDTFDYGDWRDVWFIKGIKPCMLNYDGTVAYELDPNDYTKKKDGADSDVSNIDFAGNAMVGIPKVYWKAVDNGDNTANIYFSNIHVDENFRCWSHIDANGNEIDYCYMPIYNGVIRNNTLRSISGIQPSPYSSTHDKEIQYATANNKNSDNIWYTEVWSDRMLINLLLLLIGKSTDTKTIFGRGACEQNGNRITGTLDQKGLFYGDTIWTQGKGSGVKIFGMEHYWGNAGRRISGYMVDGENLFLKLTYGQQDGSTVYGYNTTGDGYITGIRLPSDGMSGTKYISKMLVNEFGLYPAAVAGSNTTYWCDAYSWAKGNAKNITAVGKLGGAFTGTHPDGQNPTGNNASISCKPLARREEESDETRV